jgi:hypothetical protein
VTKTKGAFPSDMALLKLIYLTTQNITKKWTMPAQNWNLTLSQLFIIFGERLRLGLQVSPRDWRLEKSRQSRGAMTGLQFPLTQFPVHSPNDSKTPEFAPSLPPHLFTFI